MIDANTAIGFAVGIIVGLGAALGIMYAVEAMIMRSLRAVVGSDAPTVTKGDE